MQIDRDLKLTLVALLLVGAGFGGGLWYPNHVESRNLTTRIDALHGDLARSRQEAQQLRDLKKNVQELREVVQSSPRQIPEGNELSDLLRDFSTELVRHGTTDREIKSEPVMPGADYNALPITLRFRGPYSGAYEFIRYAESLRRLVRIHKLVMTGAPTKATDPVVVRIELATFSASNAPVEAPQP